MFEPFEKIPRLKRDCVITEKIDGTNAQIYITPEAPDTDHVVACVDGLFILAGSRSRWLLPEKSSDNFGFAQWVSDHCEELVKLGEGRHFGEWWGQGIQRRYGLDEKRFSLFNTGRWESNEERPSICGVVPVLYTGDFTTDAVDESLALLARDGSQAAPGFPRPEGVVIYHTASRGLFKVTLEKDSQPKKAT